MILDRVVVIRGSGLRGLRKKFSKIQSAFLLLLDLINISEWLSCPSAPWALAHRYHYIINIPSADIL